MDDHIFYSEGPSNSPSVSNQVVGVCVVGEAAGCSCAGCALCKGVWEEGGKGAILHFRLFVFTQGCPDAKEALVGELRFSPLSLLAAAFIFFHDHCLL